MGRTWIKLYTEILGDIKVATLTHLQHRLMINCFLMAGHKDRGGLCGTTDEIAYATKNISPSIALDGLKVLAARGIVTRNGTGWHVTNWERRQAKPPSKQAEAEAARKREQRSKGPKNVRRVSAADRVRTGCGQGADKGESDCGHSARPQGVRSDSVLVVNPIPEPSLPNGETTTRRRTERRIPGKILRMLSDICWAGDLSEISEAYAQPGGPARIEGLLRLAIKMPKEFAAARFLKSLRSGMNPPNTEDDARKYIAGEYAELIQH